MESDTKKAQSAIEYIMVYGWTILLVLIIISVLFFSGMLNFILSSENTATGFSIIEVDKFEVLGEDQELILVLSNTADLTLQIQNIQFNNENLGNIAYPYSISPGEQVVIKGDINYSLNEGDSFKNIPLKIYYVVSEGTAVHIETGMLSGKAV